MSKAARLVVHEEIPNRETVPGLTAAMRVVRDAQAKLATATGRVTEAKQVLAAAERERDALTAAVERNDIVGPSQLRDSEASIRDAEGYALLLAKGVSAAQRVVDSARQEMSSAVSAERTRRVDAAEQAKLDAIESWKRAHQVVQDAEKRAHEVRYIGVPQAEIEQHWDLVDHA